MVSFMVAMISSCSQESSLQLYSLLSSLPDLLPCFYLDYSLEDYIRTTYSYLQSRSTTSLGSAFMLEIVGNYSSATTLSTASS
jgi:hypothetical protein